MKHQSAKQSRKISFAADVEDKEKVDKMIAEHNRKLEEDDEDGQFLVRPSPSQLTIPDESVASPELAVPMPGPDGLEREVTREDGSRTFRIFPNVVVPSVTRSICVSRQCCHD